LADLKMVLADFRHWQISRHCFWVQNVTDGHQTAVTGGG